MMSERMDWTSQSPSQFRPTLKSPLHALRIYGPCHVHELAGMLGTGSYTIYRVTEELKRRGLAISPWPFYWDVTDIGRQVFQGEMEQQRRVRAAAEKAVIPKPAWARAWDGRRR